MRLLMLTILPLIIASIIAGLYGGTFLSQLSYIYYLLCNEVQENID